MIQFNLLPDVKVRYIKAQRNKNLVTLVSFIVAAVSITIFLLMIVTVDVVQKKSISDLNKDIKTYTGQLKGVSDLNDILTVQNQLNTLTSLHDQKVVASRLPGYLAQITPATATISRLTADYTQNTLTISGEAPTLDVVNSYIDTIKAAKYPSVTSPFSSVVLTTFGRDSKGATYTITTSFDPALFNSNNDGTLTVPPGTSSNTATLFQKQAGK